ncbi:hypothetical protein RUMHYD_01298 [Blautia hydrogenotrophica DSM 10507]|uniref:Uncharacterized protein n=1 Tax=Blautia hydrogenotrophica (strain DSM 10507 / JCM 14656 / S5a33) TaxID=476272 RepID=C0CKC8_BLAHS|nr:hypothetical protein RUMHYD_01298 [Blautia hydrogenotrophica DSM 10507]
MRQKKDGDVLSASVGRCELRSVSRVIWTAEGGTKYADGRAP